MHAVPTLLLRTFASPVELRTPRVLLRQWKDTDLDAWVEMNADAVVRQHFPSVLTRDEALAEADRSRGGVAQRGWGMWALEIPGVHTFAGFVGLNVPRFPAPWQPAVEIGWRLRQDAWHHGFATEAAAGVLEFAFVHLQLPQVIAMSVAPNTPSHGVMERLGMTRDLAADFEHPLAPVGWPLRTHFVHRINTATWDRLHRSAQ